MKESSLKTATKRIKDIFGAEEFYNIPEYQRPYVWEDEQVFALLNDLEQAFEGSQNSEHSKEYFLGCMVLNDNQVTCSETNQTYECHDIIDGQQRFITLFLIQSYLSKITRNPEMLRVVKERLFSQGCEFNGIPARNRVQFVRDDAAFINQQLLNSEELDISQLNRIIKNPPSVSIKNMANNICYIHKWFNTRRQQLEQQGKNFTDFDNFLGKFFTYISNKVILFSLATPNNLDDAYNLFTVLNSRGVQLRASDILRSQNLRLIADQKERELYANKWDSYIDATQDYKNGFDSFLTDIIFIKMQYNNDDNKTVLHAFEHMYKVQKDSKSYLPKGLATFKFIETYVNHYTAIKNIELQIPKDKKQVFRNLMTIAAKLDFMAPLMYFRELFGDNHLLEFFIKLDNLISANWIVNQVPTQNRMFILMRRMYEVNKNGGSALDIINSDELKYSFNDKNARTKIDINQFYETLTEENFGTYGGTKVNKIKYLLAKLDFIMAAATTDISFTVREQGVEHLMPAKFNPNLSYSQEFHENMAHKLGNLVLLDGRKNNSLANKDFHIKKAEYTKKHGNRLNTIHLFNRQSWSEQELLDNHERVLMLLKEYYTGNSLEHLYDMQALVN